MFFDFVNTRLGGLSIQITCIKWEEQKFKQHVLQLINTSLVQPSKLHKEDMF